MNILNEIDFKKYLKSLEGAAFKKKEIKKLKKHIKDIVQYLNEQLEDTVLTELETYLYEYLPEAKKEKHVIGITDEDAAEAERLAQAEQDYYDSVELEQALQDCENNSNGECNCQPKIDDTEIWFVLIDGFTKQIYGKTRILEDAEHLQRTLHKFMPYTRVDIVKSSFLSLNEMKRVVKYEQN